MARRRRSTAGLRYIDALGVGIGGGGRGRRKRGRRKRAIGWASLHGRLPLPYVGRRRKR